jgi:2,4-dienoyl-CoA reductase-like NADH-dependent reductase (Old Yellow Enzyme family)
MYGGDWHGRKRLLNEIMEQIRYACPGAIVGVRISAEEHVEGGLTREEMIDVAWTWRTAVQTISAFQTVVAMNTAHLVGTEKVAEHTPTPRRTSKGP